MKSRSPVRRWLNSVRGRSSSCGLWIDESLPGWMTRPELEVIATVAASLPDDAVVVEVGSYAGRSSAHWAANSRPSVEIHCIDPFDAVIDDFSFAYVQGDSSAVRGRPSGELFVQYTRPWADRITMVAATSPLPSWDRNADVVFIDGDHTSEGVTRDLEFWSQHLKPGGRLLGHDWDDVRVREAVEEFSKRQRVDVRVHGSTNIWEMCAPHRSGDRSASRP